MLKWATRIDGAVPDKQDKEELLLGASLANAAYIDDEEELRAALRAHAMLLLAFRPHRASISPGREMADMFFKGELHGPQWFVASKGETKYVVLRGSDSTFDWARNLMVKPASHGSGRWHAGFLAAARTQQLRDDIAGFARDGDRLCLVGHSLGGAIALTLVGAELLPSVTPPVTVLTYGSPAPCYGECITGRTFPSALQSARILSFVRGADIVPRLLGSDLSWLEWFLS